MSQPFNSAGFANIDDIPKNIGDYKGKQLVINTEINFRKKLSQSITITIDKEKQSVSIVSDGIKSGFFIDYLNKADDKGLLEFTEDGYNWLDDVEGNYTHDSVFAVTVVCNSNDTFNAYRGIRIAKKRFIQKVDSYAKASYKRFNAYVEDFMSKVEKQVNRNGSTASTKDMKNIEYEFTVDSFWKLRKKSFADYDKVGMVTIHTHINSNRYVKNVPVTITLDMKARKVFISTDWSYLDFVREFREKDEGIRDFDEYNGWETDMGVKPYIIVKCDPKDKFSSFAGSIMAIRRFNDKVNRVIYRWLINSYNGYIKNWTEALNVSTRNNLSYKIFALTDADIEGLSDNDISGYELVDTKADNDVANTEEGK